MKPEARPRRRGEARLSVVVVGGGIAGLATALRLQVDGHRVTLLAGEAPPSPAEDADAPGALRCYALSPASTTLLQAIGAGDGLTAAHPYHAMTVWGSRLGDALHFDLGDADFGAGELGHIVRHDHLHHALWQQAEARLDLRATRATALHSAARGVELDCADGELLTADLAVAADGSGSPLRQQAGLLATGWDYGQLGIVANIGTEGDLQHTAWQRFLPSGPLALLPLGRHRASIVWSLDRPLADELLAADEAHFSAALGEALQATLGEVRLLSRRLTFPLRAQHAERYVTDGLALVGDAARTVHPLAGQGLNLGLGDVPELGSQLQRHGSQLQRALAAYNRRRRAATADMLAVTDGLYRLFGPAGEGLAEFRDAGMALVNRLPPARAWLVRHAIGRANMKEILQ